MHVSNSEIERKTGSICSRTLAFFPLLLLEVLSFKVLEVVVDHNVYTMMTGK
jgi:hypothetical protein